MSETRLTKSDRLPVGHLLDLHHNLVRNCDGGFIELGIGAEVAENGPDEAIISGVRIASNTMYHSGGIGIRLNDARPEPDASDISGLVVENNIIFDTGMHPAIHLGEVVESAIHHNLFQTGATGNPDLGTSARFADEIGFNDEASGDLRLTDTSPATGAGVEGIDLGAFDSKSEIAGPIVIEPAQNRLGEIPPVVTPPVEPPPIEPPPIEPPPVTPPPVEPPPMIPPPVDPPPISPPPIAPPILPPTVPTLPEETGPFPIDPNNPGPPPIPKQPRPEPPPEVSQHEAQELARAIASARCGDTVNIPKGLYNIPLDIRNKSCADRPITIEPEVGARVVLTNTRQGTRAALRIHDVSGLIVRNLVFDSLGLPVAENGVLVTWSTDQRNVQILNNTFYGWAEHPSQMVRRPNQIHFISPKGPGPYTEDVRVEGNQLFDGRGSGIKLGKVAGAVVKDNLVMGQRCAQSYERANLIADGVPPSEARGRLLAEGFKLDKESYHIELSNNLVLSHAPIQECVDAFRGDYLDLMKVRLIGIYCDVGAYGSIAINNAVLDIGMEGSPDTEFGVQGIYAESRCHNWRIENNQLYEIGGPAIQGSSKHLGNEGLMIQNNIIGDSQVGVFLAQASQGATVSHNVFGCVGKDVQDQGSGSRIGSNSECSCEKRHQCLGGDGPVMFPGLPTPGESDFSAP